MPAVKNNTASGSKFIDDLLKSTSWSSPTVSFSFATSSAAYGATYGRGEAKVFTPFNAAQKAAALDALDAWSDVANIKFVESNAGDAVIRLGASSMPKTAWAYAPSDTGAGGDVWLGTTSYNANPVLGNYAWMTILHEIGHALGLAHPHDAGKSGFAATSADQADDGLCPCCAGILHGQGTGSQQAVSGNRSAQDAMAYSVMSYRSFVGADMSKGYLNASGSYAQSPMARDIAAMQHMYGANYETRASSTVYRWDAATGEKSINGVAQGKPLSATVFETVWDGGGEDTFDLSTFSQNQVIDLRPGSWSSFGRVADLGAGNQAPGNVAIAHLFNDDARSLIENAVAGAGNDRLTGNQTDNILIGGAGNDTIDGGAGDNILVGDLLGNELGLVGLARPAFLGPVSTNSVRGNDTLTGGDGNDIFVPGHGNDIVRGGGGKDTIILDLGFSDIKITRSGGDIVIDHAGGSVKAQSVEFLALRDGIYSLTGAQVSDQNAEDIALLYQASLGRTVDQGGLAFWKGAVDGEGGIGWMARALIESPEFATRFGNPHTLSDGDFVDVLYQNVLGRAGEQAGSVYWAGALEDGMDRSHVLLSFAQSNENRAGFTLPDFGLGANDVDVFSVRHVQWVAAYE